MGTDRAPPSLHLVGAGLEGTVMKTFTLPELAVLLCIHAHALDDLRPRKLAIGDVTHSAASM